MEEPLKCFTNCLLCISGELVAQDLYFSSERGIITANYYYRKDGVERIDLNGRIVAPGYLDLQTNGMQGIHFTQLAADGDPQEDERKLETVGKMESSLGVTGWWATVPTVSAERWKQVDLSPFLLFYPLWNIVAGTASCAATDPTCEDSPSSETTIICLRSGFARCPRGRTFPQQVQERSTQCLLFANTY